MRIIIRHEGILNFHEFEKEQLTFGELSAHLGLDMNYIFIHNGENKCEAELVKDRSIVEIEKILLGGKGGFGSLLKGQPPVKKRTTNIDSCRDLTGRRIRHSNQEKMIREWEQKKSEEERIMKMYDNPEEEKNVSAVLNEEKKNEVQEMNRKFISEALESVKSVSKSMKFLNKKLQRKEDFETPRNVNKSGNESKLKKISLNLEETDPDVDEIEKELLNAFN